MRDAENIRAVSELDIDMMGFIFWPGSPRYVQMIPSRAGIIPDYSEERIKGHGVVAGDEGRRVRRVGVFVDDMPQSIVTRVYNYQLDYVQLHGDERAVMIENLRRTLAPDIRPGIKVIKALSIMSAADFARCEEYEGVADLLLFDTRCTTVGGSGRQFDWTVLDAYQGRTPFLLSGGIGPDDADRVLALRHPLLAGIDLNSRFETAPGIKDPELMEVFLENLQR